MFLFSPLSGKVFHCKDEMKMELHIAAALVSGKGLVLKGSA